MQILRLRILAPFAILGSVVRVVRERELVGVVVCAPPSYEWLEPDMAEKDASSPADCSGGGKVSRRDACKLGLAAAVTVAGGDALSGLASSTGPEDTSGTPKSMNTKPHISVVGSGAFGGWTA